MSILQQKNIWEIKGAIEELNDAYVHCIDDGRLEEWPDFFTYPCVYKIISRENYERRLPACVIYCDSKGMLKDRVAAHRHANVFEPHVYTHLVSNLRIVGQEEDAFLVRSNYAVFQTKQDGVSELYNVGKYIDRVVFVNGEPKFKERIVVFDTLLIPTLLVTPI